MLGREVVFELDSPIYNARVVAVSASEIYESAEVPGRQVGCRDSLCSELTSYTRIGDSCLLIVGFSSEGLPDEVDGRRVADLSFGFESFCSAKISEWLVDGGERGLTHVPNTHLVLSSAHPNDAVLCIPLGTLAEQSIPPRSSERPPAPPGFIMQPLLGLPGL